MSRKIDQYRKFVSVALLSPKLYTDMGGDTCGIHVMAALFKFPDIIYDLLDMMDGKNDSDKRFVQDTAQAMLHPIVALASAYLETVDLPEEEKASHKAVLNSQLPDKIKDVIAHRNLVVNILMKLSSLRREQNENRDSRGSEQEDRE